MRVRGGTSRCAVVGRVRQAAEIAVAGPQHRDAQPVRGASRHHVAHPNGVAGVSLLDRGRQRDLATGDGEHDALDGVHVVVIAPSGVLPMDQEAAAGECPVGIVRERLHLQVDHAADAPTGGCGRRAGIAVGLARRQEGDAADAEAGQGLSQRDCIGLDPLVLLAVGAQVGDVRVVGEAGDLVPTAQARNLRTDATRRREGREALGGALVVAGRAVAADEVVPADALDGAHRVGLAVD